MEQFASTSAWQSFGKLLKAAGNGPVAIERPGKVQAFIMAPEFFEPAVATDVLAARRLARLNQALVEKDRLIRHQRIAFDLVTLPAKRREDLLKQAKVAVERWRSERLCSRDYIDRWSEILGQSAPQIAAAITSDLQGWGTALRQNSPWVGNHA